MSEQTKQVFKNVFLGLVVVDWVWFVGGMLIVQISAMNNSILEKIFEPNTTVGLSVGFFSALFIPISCAVLRKFDFTPVIKKFITLMLISFFVVVLLSVFIAFSKSSADA